MITTTWRILWIPDDAPEGLPDPVHEIVSVLAITAHAIELRTLRLAIHPTCTRYSLRSIAAAESPCQSELLRRAICTEVLPDPYGSLRAAEVISLSYFDLKNPPLA